jgi:hypothetical protein
MTKGEVTRVASGNNSAQIVFARHNFDNLQSLIRLSDTKAAGILTLVIFLGTSGVMVAKDIVPYLRWWPSTRIALSVWFLLMAAGFLSGFARILWIVQRVMQPRGAQHYKSMVVGRDLMWQDHVLAHHTQEGYFTAVSDATDAVLLRNLTDQVFELASISKDKMDTLQKARPAFWWTFLAWIGVVISGLVILRLR